jgi:endoglucanase
MKLTPILAFASALLLATAAASAAPKAAKPAAPVAAAPAAVATPPAERFAGLDAFVQLAEMKRGVNVLAEDPGWSDPAKARFKPEYFKKIHDAGFSTVRIVLNAFSHMDQYYSLESGYVERIDLMVKTALDQGLTVIIDEHDFVDCPKDVVSCTQKLNAFWAQIAPRYKDYSGRLIFELMNEPNGAFTPELWNAQIKQTLPIIRATNPVRNVIIGPGSWNSGAFLSKLELPVVDRHIIVTVHYYAPMEFTHQGSPWVPQYKLTGQNWGTPADLAQLAKDFDAVKKWSDEWNRPIFLGEFGAYETAPMDGRLKYDYTIARAAEARGFAWAYWQFDKDFVVYDVAKDSWVQPVLDALIPPPAK